MIELVQERRLETLLARLSVRLASSGDPLFPDTLVVPTVGMARWVRFGVAESNGGFAHFRIQPVGTFLWDLFGNALTGLPREPLSISALTLEIVRTLVSRGTRDEFLSAGLHLPPFENDPYWYYDFARRLADLYDRLTLYRPETILAWEEGQERLHGEDAWMSRVWRRAGARFPNHRAAILKKIKDSLGDQDVVDRLRERYPYPVHVFGHPLLPPVVVGLLAEIGEFLDVVLYHPSPSGEYSLYEKRSRSLPERTGNRLLRALGRQHQAMQQILLESVSQWEEASPGSPVHHRSLLSMIQDDIWFDRDASEREEIIRSVSPEDGSVRIVVCDSPLGEVETLRTALFGFLDRIPGLEPSDIVVLATDMERYRPYVEGVFLADPPESRIPFTVSGERPEQGLVHGFLSLLEIADSPYSALDVLSLLESGVIRRAFGFDEGDLPDLDRIFRRLGILWGLDADTRVRFGSPEPYRNTFRYGRDRLLLSLSRSEPLAPDSAAIPLESADIELWPLFERFLVVLDRLSSQKERIEGSRTLAEWGKILLGLLSDFFPEEPDFPEIEKERTLLRDTCLRFEASGSMDGALWDLGSVRRMIEREAEGQNRERSILTGKGVLFSDMVPVRGIPFRVVWILGMENSVFPRPDRPLAFDFLGRHPRPGDRSLWEDDNGLFLDAILSAGSVFCASYTGRDPKGRGPVPPASPVVLLLDAIRDGYGKEAYERAVTETFPGDGPPVSPSKAGRSFWNRSPTSEPPAERELDLSDLMEFLRSPSAHFLDCWGGIRIPREIDAIPESEPFRVDRRSERGAARFLHRTLGDKPVVGPGEFLESMGMLPHGAVREWGAAELAGLAKTFAEIEAHLGLEGYLHRVIPVHVEVRDPVWDEPFRVAGDLPLWTLPSGGWARIFPLEMHGSEWLWAWAVHLLRQTAEPSGPGPGRLFAPDDQGDWTEWTIPPVDDPQGRLAALVHLFLEGRARPLPLFSRSSISYARSVGGAMLEGPPFGAVEEGVRFRALEKALKTWEGEDGQGWGEGNYSEHILLYPGIPPIPRLDAAGCAQDPLAEFERLSLSLFRPILSLATAKGARRRP